MSPNTRLIAFINAGHTLTHYSLLRSIEALLGLPRLGAARTAPGGINRGFGLR